MQLAWLLFTKSFHTGWKRLSLIAGAVGMGVLILLLFTAGFHGVTDRMDRSSWRTFITQATFQEPQAPIAGVQPLYASPFGNPSVIDRWRNQDIAVMSMAATDSTSPSFSDLTTPQAGEYYVSPGLKKVIDEHPEDNVGDRFGSHLAGVIPDDYTTSPDELLVVRGIDLAEAKDLAASNSMAVLYSTDQSGDFLPAYPKVIKIVVFTGIFILLFPVMLLISIATQLGSAQREKRYAALRLIGASRKNVRQIMLFESLIATAIGIILACVAYLLIRPLLLSFTFQGMHFWPHDVSVSIVELAIIIAVTFLFTGIANWWGMRHVQTSPLGVVRSSRVSKKPRLWRLLIFVLGVGMIGSLYLPYIDETLSALLLLGGVIILMFGLVIAGPSITYLASSIIGRFTKRAEILLGMKYIKRHSREVFRSVAGVVVALFAGSFYLTSVSGIQHIYAEQLSDNAYEAVNDDTVIWWAFTFGDQHLPAGQASELAKLDYIDSASQITTVADGRVLIMSCADASHYTSINCPGDSSLAGLSTIYGSSAQDRYWYGNSVDDIFGQMQLALNLNSDSSRVQAPSYLLTISDDNIDKLRSYIAVQYPDSTQLTSFLTDGSEAKKPYTTPIIDELASLVYLGIAITMVVAIISLAISTTGGMLERRRSLITLRLTGMTPGALKRVIIIESLVPLLTVTVLSAGLGIWSGATLMYNLAESYAAQLSLTFIVIFIVSIAVAIAAISLILPLVNKISDPSNNQSE